jgi:hypothetical protein
MTRRWPLVEGLLLLALIPAPLFAAQKDTVKHRFSQFSVGDKILCLSDINFKSNNKIKVIESGFVIAKKGNSLTYQTAIIYLLGHDVTVNIKAIINSQLASQSFSNQFKQAYIEVQGLDKSEQAPLKAKILDDYRKSIAEPQDDIPYHQVKLTDNGYQLTQNKNNIDVASNCFISQSATKNAAE